MIETPKEPRNDDKPIFPTTTSQKDNKGPQIVDPLTQDIVEEFVKINGEKYNKVYKKVSMLGKGGFAECFLTQQKETNKRMATKIIPKKLLDSHRTKIRLANQIKLHKSLRHQNVVEFYNNFEDEQNVYINLEVCENGSLNDLLRTRFRFKTPEVQSFLYGICQGLKYLHSRNIIHRDLKLGNILLNSQMEVKIGDFGLACRLEFNKEFKRTVCGTPNYIAPEILQVDIWALGVALYTLFYTIPPFETEEPHTTYQKIRKCQYQFPEHFDVPPEAIDLIKKLLVPNPANRLTLDQILVCPFMKIGASIPKGLPSCVTKRPPTKKQLANWPKILTKQSQQQEKEMNSTMLGFFGITKKVDKEKTLCIQKSQCPDLRNQTLCGQNQQERVYQSQIPIFCRRIQHSSTEIITFYLNNGNFGVYDLTSSQVFTCELKQKSQKVIDGIKKSIMSESGNIISENMLLAECRHKIPLNIKHKQLLNEKVHILIPKDIQKSTTISKINIYKDLFMIRLTNRVIQIVFKQRDGFLLSPSRKQLTYFNSFKDLDEGKEVDLSLALKLGFNDKENRGSSPGKFSFCSIFKSKKNQKHQLTMKKISYLKAVLMQTSGRGTRKHV